MQPIALPEIYYASNWHWVKLLDLKLSNNWEKKSKKKITGRLRMEFNPL